MAKQVIKKDNYFSVTVSEHQEVTVIIDGEEVTKFYMPYAGEFRGYLCREKKAIEWLS